MKCEVKISGAGTHAGTGTNRITICLLIVVCMIFTLGLAMIYDTTSAAIIERTLDKSTHQALIRQLVNAVVGCVLALVVWAYPYQKFLKLSPYLFICFTGLLILCMLPGIGREVNGSKRWVSLFGFSLQPSEFVKIILPSYFIQQMRGIANIDLKIFCKLMAKIAIPLGLILIEPNNGTVGVIVLTLLVLFLLTEVPLKFWALPLAIFLVIGGLSASQLSYVKARIRVYLNPELDLKGKGHQPYQAKIAAGSGKLLGKGPGNSLQKLRYLPEAQNDYIAAIYAEEFGFIGIVLLIILYMILAYCGFSIAFHAKDQEGFLMASFITFLISFQAFMNLGVVSGLLPSTGLNLPYFSQGGTSIMANTMGLGLLLNIGQSK